MDIVVCIKQVPDTTDVKINPQTNTLVRDGVRSIVNPFDLFAIEAALEIKEKTKGKVTVITMGPPQARVALDEAVAMGADDAMLISNRAFAGSDTLATSYILSQAIKRLDNFDLIVCGKQAADGDTAQVGPGIAVHLALPQVTFVKRIREIDKGSITVERMTASGFDLVRTPLPTLITVVKELCTPRYTTFPGKVRAKRMDLPSLGPSELKCDPERIGLDGSPTWVERIFAPPVRKGCKPLEPTDENIERLARDVAENLEDVWE